MCPAIAFRGIAKMCNILHVNGLSFLVLPYVAYCVLGVYFVAQHPWVVGWNDQQEMRTSSNIHWRVLSLGTQGLGFSHPSAPSQRGPESSEVHVAVLGAGVLPQLIKRQLLLNSWDLLPFLDAHTSSISRQNCRTPFALEISEGKTVSCVTSRISQPQQGWALQE